MRLNCNKNCVFFNDEDGFLTKNSFIQGVSVMWFKTPRGVPLTSTNQIDNFSLKYKGENSLAQNRWWGSVEPEYSRWNKLST